MFLQISRYNKTYRNLQNSKPFFRKCHYKFLEAVINSVFTLTFAYL